MRSFDRAMPEEVNRVLTDHLVVAAAVLVAGGGGQPRSARASPGAVELVGDVMVDVALLVQPRARERPAPLRDAGVEPGEYLLVTAHRAGNVDDPARLERLVDAAARRCPCPVVLPLHPRTRARLEAAGLLDAAGARRASSLPPRRLPRVHRAARRTRGRCSPTPAACRRRPTSPACRA